MSSSWRAEPSAVEEKRDCRNSGFDHRRD